MDPILHLLLPILFLLAIRIDAKKVIMFAPLAILPDFDAAFGLHRVVFHSFIAVLVIPLALIAYAKFRKPEWMLGALLVQFYMASHIVLDLAGVSFLWPFTKDQFFFDPEVQFNLQGGINFIFHLHYGLKSYTPMGTTDFLSEAGFAAIFLGILLGVVFRKECMASLRKLGRIVSGFLSALQR